MKYYRYSVLERVYLLPQINNNLNIVEKWRNDSNVIYCNGRSIIALPIVQ